jgi:hypothetical protein
MITKLKIFKENNILVPRNLEGRREKFIKQQSRLFQQEVITGYIDIDKDFYLDFTNVKTKKIIGNVWIEINKIPLWLKDIEINGHFFCDGAGLTTLEGCPQIVNDGFWCGGNYLTSLEHCPKYVDGNFYCYGNKVQFTEEDVKKLCKVNAAIICEVIDRNR